MNWVTYSHFWSEDLFSILMLHDNTQSQRFQLNNLTSLSKQLNGNLQIEW